MSQGNVRIVNRGMTALAAGLVWWAGQATAALQVRVEIGKAEGGPLPMAVRDLVAGCVLHATGSALHCDDAELSFRSEPGGVSQLQGRGVWSPSSWEAQLLPSTLLGGTVEGQAHYLRDSRGRGQADASLRLDGLSYEGASGRYATDKGSVALDVLALLDGAIARFDVRLSSSVGQAYVEPVFIDLAAHPLELSIDGVWDSSARLLRDLNLSGSQTDLIGNLSAQISAIRAAGPFRIEQASLNARDVRLDGLVAGYLVPFLAGTPWESISASGSADLKFAVAHNAPVAADLELRSATLKAAQPASAIENLDGSVHWVRDGDAEPSSLRWDAANYASLPLGPASLRFEASRLGLHLLEPMRQPILDGALVVQRFALADVGKPSMSADLVAELEPIELGALCRALGWPEFGGRLSGRVPGVQLRDGELSLDGGLDAKVFGGDVRIGSLRMPDVFGRLRKLLADVQLRNLDLRQLTQAFSFGRIDGHIDGDVSGLRMLDWQPVAFDARLYSSPNDPGRRRISQRAIDNLSSLGGGPTGLLSRGALRFFDDFGYRRIGWSCKLVDGVCLMDGIEPTEDGGYVLVEGRWLPRIEVVGYERRVDWNRFVEQLLAVRQSQGVEIR